MTAEEWRTIPGFAPDYEVSNLGRVRSWKQRGGTVPRILGQWPRNTDGRPCVAVGDERCAFVHKLVALAFLGPRPPGMVVRHIDGDNTNNAATNLTHGTQSENVLDQVAHGTHRNASKTHCIRDHEFTPENTYLYFGRRQCRECTRRRNALIRKRRQAMAAAS